MITTHLSAVLLSHPRGAVHREFPQFPQAICQSRAALQNFVSINSRIFRNFRYPFVVHPKSETVK